MPLDLGIEIAAVADGVCPLSTADLCNVFIKLGEMVAGSPLYKYQSKIAFSVFEAVLDNEGEILTLLCARQSGKSQVVAVICSSLMILMPLLASVYPNDPRFNLYNPDNGIYLGYKTGIKIGVFGPKKEQADIIYNRIRGFFETTQAREVLVAFELEFTVSNGRTCSLNNGSSVTAQTANDGSSIEGGSYHLLLTDETQRISDQMIKKSILPMGASVNATTVHIGTATIGKCYFYTSCRQNMRTFAIGGRKCHFEVDWIEAASENQFYKKFVLSQKKRFGERSDEFLMAFCNKWILERGQFVSERVIEEVMDKTRRIGDYSKQSWIPRLGRLSCAAGIDFGKQNDRTVCTIGVIDYQNPLFEQEIQDENGWSIITHFGVDVIEWLSFEGDDHETQYLELRKKLKFLPFPLKRLALDATGCGGPICDRFRADFQDTDVVPFVFSSQSKDALFRNYIRAIRSRQVSIPSDDLTVEELDFKLYKQEMLDLEKNYSQGLLVVKHPDEPGAHDDYPDSGALLSWCGASRPTLSEIEVESMNSFFR